MEMMQLSPSTASNQTQNVAVNPDSNVFKGQFNAMETMQLSPSTKSYKTQNVAVNPDIHVLKG